MRILLDECITKRVKKYLIGLDVTTVSERGWSGIKNGKLMRLCIEHQIDILLTIDKNLIHQQNISSLSITIVVLNTPSSKSESIKEYLPNFLALINSFEKSRSYIIDK
jgi:hypothetical protein